MPHTIVIAGYYGFGNTGDELILEAMVKDLRQVLPDANLIVISGNPAQTAARFGVGSIPWSDIGEIDQGIGRCDLVILGGGGIFHDYWGFDQNAVLTSAHIGISFYTSVALLASIHAKPLMLYAVGVGPLTTEQGKMHVKAIADQSAVITVRDRQSRDLLANLGIPPTRLVLTSDPVVNLRFDHAETSKPTHSDNKRLGIVLRNWDVGIEPRQWEKRVAEALDDFLDAHPDFETSFIPFQDAAETLLDDQGVARRIRKRMRNSISTKVLTKSLSPHMKAEWLASCDLVLGMRLHSLMVAAAAGIPMIGLCYDPKVRIYLQQLGLEKYAVNLQQIKNVDLSGLLEDAFIHRDGMAETVLNRHSQMTKRTALTAQLAARILSGAGEELGKTAKTLDDLQKQATLSLMDSLEAKTRTEAELKENIQTLSEYQQVLLDQADRRELTLEQNRLQIVNLTEQVISLENRLSSLKLKQKEEIASLGRQNEALNDRNLEAQKEIQSLSSQLVSIKSSRGWKLLWRLWQIRLFFIPSGSKRERILKLLFGFSRSKLKNIARQLRSYARGVMGWTGLKWSAYAACFKRYKRQRSRLFPSDLSRLRVPCQKGLVSIVLPLYNGKQFVHEALESILQQTYSNFELIIVDDGSTDGSGAIADEYARRDGRITVVHQQNRKLPGALNCGFDMAHGEYLTWTSDDNVLKPDFLMRMVSCMMRHPRWDMAYANMDIIGDHGEPLRNSPWFEGYQVPHGSEHVILPVKTSELNTYPNNFVGGAFIYRKRVHHLLAGYSPWQFTREDYDYWMQVHALLTLRHSGFSRPVYNYRFHPRSLTSQDGELKITGNRKFLMVFDDYRRDFYLKPLIWVVDGDEKIPSIVDLIEKIKKRINAQGGIILSNEDYHRLTLPRLWQPVIHLSVVQDAGSEGSFNRSEPAVCIEAVLHLSEILSGVKDSGKIYLHYGSSIPAWESAVNCPTLFSSPDLDELLTALDIRARSAHLRQIEAEIAHPPREELRLTVVVCTYHRSQSLENTLRSLGAQTTSKRDFEVVVVDNSPPDSRLEGVLEKIRNEEFSKYPSHLRLIDCPVLGLSHARNAGISEARGRLILFLDDDAVADPDLIHQYLAAFTARGDMGLIGGHIRLERPDRIDMPWKKGLERYWSQFITGYKELTAVSQWWEFPWGANWCARRDALLQIGGFRGRYGRRGNDFSGGEEIIAASLMQQLGYSVGILPQAHVIHRVDPARFTLTHLKHTIRAGLYTHYQMQRDLYLPGDSSHGRALGEVFIALERMFIGSSDLDRDERKAERIEAAYKLESQIRLLGKKLWSSFGG